MTLSILEAAEEHPDGVALVFGGETAGSMEERTITFGALAASVRERQLEIAESSIPYALVAAPALDALVTFYACVESRVPVGLLDPRWAPAELAMQRDRLRLARPRSDDSEECALALLFTSGTSGRRKIVELSRRAFVAAENAFARSQGWTSNDRWFLALPFAHVGGLSVLTRSLIARRPVVVFGARSFEPVAVRQAIAAGAATILSLVPTQLERLADGPPPATVRTVLLGGAAARPSLFALARANGWPVLPSYGMTETCAQIAAGAPARALPGVELRIVDGVVEVRSPTLLSAYVEGAVRDCPVDSAGWFRTRDLGELDPDGSLRILGRADDVIITGGEKVRPWDVERALERVPGVQAACVVGLDDTEWGQVVGAAVVATGRLAAAEIEVQLATSLARFQRPKRWLFLERLPQNAMGKLDRLAVAQLLSRPSEP